MVFKPQRFHDVPPQVERDNPTEAELEARVAEALARAGAMDAAQVDVTAKGSIVTLTGIVSQAREIETAAEVAADVPGVSAVENLIQAMQRGD